jgi:hypothetical protein
MDYQCYYCEQIFDSKEKLYYHLEVHAKPPNRSEKKTKRKNTRSEKKRILDNGNSPLTDDEIIEQFNESKRGEPSRMSQKN